MQRGLWMWAEVQVAQIACLRSGQRLQRYLHGLVPLSVVLRLQMWSHQQIHFVEHSKLKRHITDERSLDTLHLKLYCNSFGQKLYRLLLGRVYQNSNLAGFYCALDAKSKKIEFPENSFPQLNQVPCAEVQIVGILFAWSVEVRAFRTTLSLSVSVFKRYL